MKRKVFLLMLSLIAFSSFGLAQAETTAKKMSEADYSKDHESIDSIIAATYDVISGSSETKRDWARFRSLFHKDARLIPSGRRPDGTGGARAFTPDEYITRSEPFMMKNGFFEKEITKRTEIYGNIAHVFSTYEGRNKLSDEKPFMRGINSFQLLNDGKRWWVVTIFWLGETPDNQLPEKYLKTKD